MSRGTKIGIALIVAVVVVGGVIALGASRKANRPVDVRLDTVQRRSLVAAVTASGQIEAKTDVDISADVTARIIKIHVKEGDMVKQGELLIELDQAQFKGAVQVAQATLAQATASETQAQVNRDQSKRTMDRQNALEKSAPTLITTESVETAKQGYEVAAALLKAAQAQVQQAEASLKESQDNLARTMIYSPISGRVVRLAVEEGEVAVPGTFSKETGLLMRIADLSVILAKVKVDETDVVRLALGDSASVSIDAFPDTTFVGRVTKIGNSQSASSTTTTTSTDQAVDFDVEVTLRNPPKDVRPDLSMTARIITDVRPNALSIPIIALTARAAPHPAGDTTTKQRMTPGDTTQQAKEQDGVFVVHNGLARFRPVKVGIAGDDYFEVLDGLQQGDTVVSGSYQVIRDMKDSTRVRAAPATTTTGKP